MAPLRVWLATCALLHVLGWGLSTVGALRAGAYALVAVCSLAALGWQAWPHLRTARVRPARWWVVRGPRSLRFLFGVVWLLVLLGGLLHPLTTWDTLAYRLPRVCHWVAEGQWHWIHAPREWLNNRAPGYEFLMLPLVAWKLFEFLWVPNLISFSLLPGLVFATLRRLGTPIRAAYSWMWVLPTAAIFVMQAASTMNDLAGAVFLLAALRYGLAFRRHGAFADFAWSLLAAALLTGLKLTHLPLVAAWLVLVMPGLFPLLRQAWPRVLLVGSLAVLCSALPIMVANQLRYQDWSGLKGEEELQAGEKPYAVAGNLLLITLQNLAPPIFPGARHMDLLVKKALPAGLEAGLARNFEGGFLLMLGEVPSEGRSGLGLTIFLLLGALAFSRPDPRPSPQPASARRLAQLLLLTGALACGAYFLKAAAITAARLSALHLTVVLIAALALWHPGRPQLLRRRGWWRLCQLHLLIAAVASVLNPNRPLLPFAQLASWLPASLAHRSFVQQVVQTYQVVPGHLAGYDPLLDQLAVKPRTISAILDPGDLEGPLWVRLPLQRLTAVLNERDLRALQNRPGEVVLASESGLRRYFSTAPEAFLARLQATPLATATLHFSNSGAPERWFAFQLPHGSASSSEAVE